MSSPLSTQTFGREDVARFPVRMRRVVVVMLAFLAALSWHASASASCGNYLFRNGKPVADHGISMGEMHSNTAENSASQGDPDGLPARPCSGPNCSSNPIPFAPVPPVPSTLMRGFDQAAVLESLASSQPDSVGIVIPESERGACYEPSSIFRPPAA